MENYPFTGDDLAHILRALLRDAIEAMLPAGALHSGKVAETSEREHLGRKAAMLAERRP